MKVLKGGFASPTAAAEDDGCAGHAPGPGFDFDLPRILLIEAFALDGVKLSADGLMGDIHASPEYRANLIVVMAKRAVAQANG